MLVLATGFDAISGSMLRLNPKGRGGVSLKEFLAWWEASGSGTQGVVGSAVSSLLDGSALDAAHPAPSVAVWHSNLEAALEEADKGRIMRLRVKVLGCKELPSKDIMGKNDVYATLEMVGAFEIHEEFSQRTTTVRNGGQAPRWAEGGETFVFDTLEVPSTLEVEVFDEDVGSADDKIGRVSVTLEDKLIKPTFGGDDHACRPAPATNGNIHAVGGAGRYDDGVVHGRLRTGEAEGDQAI